MSEVWNSVRVYGSASEIERFKQSCVHPDDPSFTHSQHGWNSCNAVISVPLSSQEGESPAFRREYVSNFQKFYIDQVTVYAFSFDTDHSFPDAVFKRIAKCFPRLVFDCNCIEELDNFMGYGWFNPPPGGKGFSQSHKVPKNYWTSGSGFKRTKIKQAKHSAYVSWLAGAVSLMRTRLHRMELGH